MEYTISINLSFEADNNEEAEEAWNRAADALSAVLHAYASAMAPASVDGIQHWMLTNEDTDEEIVSL